METTSAPQGSTSARPWVESVPEFLCILAGLGISVVSLILTNQALCKAQSSMIEGQEFMSSDIDRFYPVPKDRQHASETSVQCIPSPSSPLGSESMERAPLQPFYQQAIALASGSYVPPTQPVTPGKGNSGEARGPASSPESMLPLHFILTIRAHSLHILNNNLRNMAAIFCGLFMIGIGMTLFLTGKQGIMTISANRTGLDGSALGMKAYLGAPGIAAIAMGTIIICYTLYASRSELKLPGLRSASPYQTH